MIQVLRYIQLFTHTTFYIDKGNHLIFFYLFYEHKKGFCFSKRSICNHKMNKLSIIIHHSKLGITNENWIILTWYKTLRQRNPRFVKTRKNKFTWEAVFKNQFPKHGNIMQTCNTKIKSTSCYTKLKKLNIFMTFILQLQCGT